MQHSLKLAFSSIWDCRDDLAQSVPQWCTTDVCSEKNLRKGKKSMRRSLIGLVAVAMTATVLAACGSSSDAETSSPTSSAPTADDSTGDAPADEPSDEPADEPAEETPPAELTKVVLGYPSDTASYTDLYFCKDAGVFEKHGLDVELSLLKESSQILAALVSGSVDIVGGDGQSLAAGIMKGADVQYVELKIPRYFVEMWTDPSITSLEDLRGKRVGVTGPGSITDTATRLMLEDKGLAADVEVVNITPLSALVAAAKQGEVDALVTAPPQGATTSEDGWTKLTDMTEYPTAAGVYAVTTETANDRADMVQRFVSADVECLNALHDEANREQILDSIQDYTQTEDRDLVAYAFDFFLNVWAQEPLVDEAILREAFELSAEKSGEGEVPADLSPYINNSFVENAIG